MEYKQIKEGTEPYFTEFCKEMHTWWTKENYENWSLEKVTYYLKHCLKDTIPSTYILHEENTFIGSYQILMEDLDSRPDLYPWLANVYIKKEYRGKGYGRKCIEHAIKTIKDMNLSKIYLFTEHRNLYEKFGFTLLEEVETFGNEKEYLYYLNRKEENNDKSSY